MNYVGQNTAKVDAAAKARGEARYAGDHYAADMLYVAVVRSPYGHALIKEIDLSAVPKGVYAFTGKDIPVNIVSYMIDDQQVLASDKVRFDGEPVAVVAADTREAAQAAAKLVRVEYEPLEPVTDARQALHPDAPKVHGRGNLLVPFKFDRGEADQAFAVADLVLEEHFNLPTQEHIYMEPEAAFACYEGDVLTVYVTTQNVFLDHRNIFRSLALAPEKVRVVAEAVGGGFGGKAGHIIQTLPALVTFKTGRPASLIVNRRDSIRGSYKRHATEGTVKVAFKKDGTMTAIDSDLVMDTGAYMSYGPVVLGMLCEHLSGPYRIDNYRLDNKLMLTNRAPASAMRGFGAPQALFIIENIMNKAARKLGLDPIEIRLKNAIHKGDIGCLGDVMRYSTGISDALIAVRDSQFWKDREKNTDPNIGYGVASGFIGVGMGRKTGDTAKVDLEEDRPGHYKIYCGLVDMGQGNTTGIAQIAAEELGVSIKNVEMVMSDTAQTYNCNDTVASRSAYIGGNAILNAVAKLREEREKNPAINRVTAQADYPESDMDLGILGLPHAMYAFMAQAAKVHVCPLTGKVTVLEVFGATEAGKILNPQVVEGQVFGGIVMSMGYALTECLNYKDGRAVETDMAKYIVATAMDTPKMESVCVEIYEDTGPYGIKGVGEIGTVAITPAITSAVTDVVGREFHQIPINPEEVLDALASRKREA